MDRLTNSLALAWGQRLVGPHRTGVILDLPAVALNVLRSGARQWLHWITAITGFSAFIS
jgi:hypothetical protein